MTSQLSFDAGLARSTDPLESQLASKRISKATEREIEALLDAHPERDWTADEIVQALPHRREHTVKSAFSRVKKSRGLIQTGRRPSITGSPMSAWRVAS